MPTIGFPLSAVLVFSSRPTSFPFRVCINKSLFAFSLTVDYECAELTLYACKCLQENIIITSNEGKSLSCVSARLQL